MGKRAAVTLLGAGLLTTMVQPADANFFERLFGGFARRVQPQIERVLPELSPVIRAPAPSGGADLRFRGESGPRAAYCVRTCDGHYFPVHANANMSAAQMCQAFCPSAETKIFAGGGIDYAAAPDGSHYRDLKNAFLYRKQLVANCTCNGKTPFGLAKLDINNDPTLAQGDIVVTNQGLAAVAGRNHNGLQFTKIDESRAAAPRERSRTAARRPDRAGSSSPMPPPAETAGSAVGED